MDLGLDLDFGFGNKTSKNTGQKAKKEEDLESQGVKKSRRRTVECTELSQKYEYRRAFSEVSLLDAMHHQQLQENHTYNFIAGGDVDSLSYLKVVLDHTDLDYVLCSTWCMAAEDILQMQEWWKAGKIKHFDTYVGEIFPNQYRVEFRMLRDFYFEHPECGRYAVFRNHSKIYAGMNKEKDFYFGIQTSANINTNPRTEQGSIIIDKGIYDFYKEYFDGIISFDDKEQKEVLGKI